MPNVTVVFTHFTAIYIVFAFQKMEKKFDSKGQLFFD